MIAKNRNAVKSLAIGVCLLLCGFWMLFVTARGITLWAQSYMRGEFPMMLQTIKLLSHEYLYIGSMVMDVFLIISSAMCITAFVIYRPPSFIAKAGVFAGIAFAIPLVTASIFHERFAFWTSLHLIVPAFILLCGRKWRRIVEKGHGVLGKGTWFPFMRMMYLSKVVKHMADIQPMDDEP
jgi:hypothetical protein